MFAFSLLINTMVRANKLLFFQDFSLWPCIIKKNRRRLLQKWNKLVNNFTQREAWQMLHSLIAFKMSNTQHSIIFALWASHWLSEKHMCLATIQSLILTRDTCVDLLKTNWLLILQGNLLQNLVIAVDFHFCKEYPTTCQENKKHTLLFDCIIGWWNSVELHFIH